MVVEELRSAGLKPGRWGASEDVEEACEGKGDGTVSGARSVSAKKPPSMCGCRFRLLTSSWIGGDSGALGLGVKKGWNGDAMGVYIVRRRSKKGRGNE